MYRCESESHSVVSNSLWPHELYSSWSSPGQNTGAGSHSLLQGIFPTQGLNPGHRCESCIIKKAEHWRIDAFELWCWGRLLRIPWTIRSNESILKEINPEYSLKGPMLKLKLQYFGHLMKRDGSLKKALTLGKIAGERRDRQRMISLGIITDSMAMNLSKLQETVKDKGAW